MPARLTPVRADAAGGIAHASPLLSIVSSMPEQLVVSTASSLGAMNGAARQNAAGGEARLTVSRPGDGGSRRFSMRALETCPHTPSHSAHANACNRNQYSSPFLLTDFVSPSRISSSSPASTRSVARVPVSPLMSADRAATSEVYSHHRTRHLRPSSEWMPPPPKFVSQPAATPSRATAASRRALQDASNFYLTAMTAVPPREGYDWARDSASP